MTSPDDGPENDATFAGLSSVVAGLMEDGSVLAGRARTAADVSALQTVLADLTTLTAAMAVLLRTRL